MVRRPPRSTHTDTLFPYTTLCRSDCILWDGSGSANNDFLGSVSVTDLTPASDVALNWALTGAATGAEAVDDFPPDDDTSYIYAVDPPPAATTMELTDLNADVSSVKGLIIFNRSKKTDGGDRKSTRLNSSH